MEDHLGHMPEPENPSWVFPGDIVQVNAPEDYTIFHDQGNDETPPNRQQHQEESLARDEEIRENHGNTPHGLSPPQNYIPTGLRAVRPVHPHPSTMKKKHWNKS